MNNAKYEWIKEFISSEKRKEIPRDYNEECDNAHADREKLYTELLRNYNQIYFISHTAKETLKTVFFYMVMISMLLILLGSIVVFIILAIKQNTLKDIGVAIGALASFISTIFALPKIIARHLFPIDEDKHIAKLVRQSMDYDRLVRKKKKDDNK